MSVKENKEEVLNLIAKIRANILTFAQENLNEKFYEAIKSGDHIRIRIFDDDLDDIRFETIKLPDNSNAMQVMITSSSSAKDRFRMVIQFDGFNIDELSKETGLCSGLIGPVGYWNNWRKGIQFVLHGENDLENSSVNVYMNLPDRRIHIPSKKIYEQYLPILRRISVTKMARPPKGFVPSFYYYYKELNEQPNLEKDNNPDINHQSQELYATPSEEYVNGESFENVEGRKGR